MSQSCWQRGLLDAGANPNVRDGDGSTPLHWAVITGDLAAIKALLDTSANPNIKDESGMTPLHQAAMRAKDNAAVIEALLAAGADSSAKDAHRRTPWDYAKEWKDPETLKGHEVYQHLHDRQF